MGFDLPRHFALGGEVDVKLCFRVVEKIYRKGKALLKALRII